MTIKTCTHTVIEESSRHVPLTHGYCAIVDAEDYEKTTRYQWCYNRGYAVRGRDGFPPRLLHNVILPPIEGLTVDHINPALTLDNRKSNLRYATRNEQMRNRRPAKGKKYKGIYLVKRARMDKWDASIRVNGKLLYLGTFEKAEDAATAYNQAAIKHFGEFAYLNSVE